MENNSGFVIFCEECAQMKRNEMYNILFPYKGYYPLTNAKDKCPDGHSNIITTNITSNDYHILCSISDDTNFFEAMMKLKENDIIEYESRMSQFRLQVTEQKKAEEEKENKTPVLKCPKCGSTNITTGSKGVGFFRGFLGADQTVNRCGNCGHTFKPKRY